MVEFESIFLPGAPLLFLFKVIELFWINAVVLMDDPPPFEAPVALVFCENVVALALPPPYFPPDEGTFNDVFFILLPDDTKK